MAKTKKNQWSRIAGRKVRGDGRDYHNMVVVSAWKDGKKILRRATTHSYDLNEISAKYQKNLDDGKYDIVHLIRGNTVDMVLYPTATMIQQQSQQSMAVAFYYIMRAMMGGG